MCLHDSYITYLFAVRRDLHAGGAGLPPPIGDFNRRAPEPRDASGSGAGAGALPALVRALATTALLLCFGLVVLGAYVRLTDAGLGCPDWPGCYGHLTPSAAAADAATASATAPGGPLQIGKAWREMVHRYAAATLGLLILSLAVMGVAGGRRHVLPLRYVAGLLAIVVAQGLLGMLTVTWRLNPVVVTLHLLLGCTTLSLLLWLVLSLRGRAEGGRAAPMQSGDALRQPQRLALVGLIALAAQIALGGWTSSNYAAVACPDFPMCQGEWWPSPDLRSAFAGGVLEAPARVAIHFTHRLGALIVTIALLSAATAALRLQHAATRRVAALMLAALTLQVAIGITMVLQGFPLWLATAHNAGAACLLMATVALNRTLRPLA